MNNLSRDSTLFLISLYITFFSYLFTIKYAFIASAYVLIGLYLLLAVKVKVSMVSKFLFVFFLNFLISIFVGFNWRETSLLFWLVLIIPVFQTRNINRKKFLEFVNVTYLIYLSLSILVSIHIVPAGLNPGHGQLNQFDDVLGDTGFMTLVGFGGSTADIDSYSVIVFFYNLLFNIDRKSKWIMTSISSAAVFATLRFTPLFSAILAIFIVLNKNRLYLQVSRFIYMALLSVSFLTLFAFPKLDDLLFLVTHGRSEIWSIYIKLLQKEELSKFLFGYRETHLPYISVSVWQEEFSNAHSSFLRLFLHWGIFMYIVYILFFLHLYFKTNSRKIIYLQSVIFTAAITNMNIFWNDNPVYWFILLYISYCYTKQDKLKTATYDYRN